MPQIVAAVMPAPLVPVELREFPEPNLEPRSLLLRTLYFEVCGTDVRRLDGTAVVEGDRLVFFDVHRAQAYAPFELHQALADAEAMRLPKALVKPS